MSDKEKVGHFEVEIVKVPASVTWAKAFANLKIVLDIGTIVVKDFQIKVGKDGSLWVSAPSKKGKDKEGNEKYFESVHMLSKDGRANLHSVILGAYRSKAGEPEKLAPKEEEPAEFS